MIESLKEEGMGQSKEIQTSILAFLILLYCSLGSLELTNAEIPTVSEHSSKLVIDNFNEFVVVGSNGRATGAVILGFHWKSIPQPMPKSVTFLIIFADKSVWKVERGEGEDRDILSLTLEQHGTYSMVRVVAVSPGINRPKYGACGFKFYVADYAKSLSNWESTWIISNDIFGQIIAEELADPWEKEYKRNVVECMNFTLMITLPPSFKPISISPSYTSKITTDGTVNLVFKMGPFGQNYQNKSVFDRGRVIEIVYQAPYPVSMLFNIALSIFLALFGWTYGGQVRDFFLGKRRSRKKTR